MATNEDRQKFDPALIDALLEGRDPQTVLRSGGLLGELKKALAERMLNAEMDVHLGSEAERAAGNHRNGPARRRCTPMRARWSWRFRATATGASIRC